MTIEEPTALAPSDDLFVKNVKKASKHIARDLDLSQRTKNTKTTTAIERIIDTINLLPGWLIYTALSIFIMDLILGYMEIDMSFSLMARTTELWNQALTATGR